MLNANSEQLRQSAQTKKEAAKALIIGKSPHYPVPAAYLAHVALECALKYRILVRNKAKHIEELRRRLPRSVFDGLFSGISGHDLHHLERTAGLARFLTAIGSESLLDREEWRLMGGDRPYSLRYGCEKVPVSHASRQVEFAGQLASLILQD